MPNVCEDYMVCLSRVYDRVNLDVPLKIEDVMECAWPSFTAQIEHLSQGKHQTPQLNKALWRDLQPEFTARLKVDEFKMRFSRRWKGSPIIVSEEPLLIYDTNICLYECSTHGKSILPTTCLLACGDSIQRQWSSLLYAKVYDIFKPSLRSSLYRRIRTIIPELYRARYNYGNKFYKVMGMWHSLIVSTILRDPKNVECPELITTLVKDLAEIAPGFVGSTLYRLMTELPSDIEHAHLLMESGGLYKAFGHPIINMDSALNIVREYACNPKYVPLEPGQIMIEEFNAMFCQGYFKEHGCWPNLSLSAAAPQPLRDAISDNYWPRSHQMRDISTENFADISLGKNLEFDYHPDLVDFLQDKACSPPYEDWTTAFDPCGFKLHHGQRPPRKEPPVRRVMTKVLTSEEKLAQRIIDEVNEGEFLKRPGLYLLCPKECELKEDPRLFSIVDFEERIFHGLVVQNLGKFIFKYLKTQTMTKTELQNLKESYNYASEADLEDLTSVLYFIRDFLKFNCQWRIDHLYKLCRALDNLFGFKGVFMAIHQMFMRAYVVALCRTRPPRIGLDGGPEVGRHCHILNDGGFEGLAQKLWTLGIQLLLLRLMRELGIRGRLDGQGDNQKLIVRLTLEQRKNPKAIATRVLAHIAKRTKEWGLPIKPEECWYSLRLVETNKELYLGGIQLSNGLKFASKVSSDSNDITGSFETKISSIATTCEAVGRRVSVPAIPLLIHSVEVIVACRQKGFLGTELKPYMATPIWPSVLGGIPISAYINFVLRGYPDSLTNAVSLMKFLSKNNTRLLQALLALIPFQFSSHLALELLMLNPGALNLSDSLNQSAFLTEFVRECVSRIATNPTIKGYASMDVKHESQELAMRLYTMDSYYAPMASEIFRCSNAGLARQFIGLFDNCRTIVKLTQSTSERGIIRELREKEDEYLSMVNRFRQRPPVVHPMQQYLDSSPCPTEISRSIRMSCWNKEIHGATYALPSDQASIVDIDDASDEVFARSFIVSSSHQLSIGGSQLLDTRGPFKPYFGSKTLEKTYKPVIRDFQTIAILQAGIRQGTILSWIARVGSQALYDLVANDLLKKQISSNINSPIVTGGNLFHRFSAALTSHGCLISTPLHHATHIKLATSTMTALRDQDYTIYYQELFLWVSWLLLHFGVNHQNAIPRNLLVYLGCEMCTRPVPENRITMSGQSDAAVDLPITHPIQEEHQYIKSLFLSISIARDARNLDIRDIGDQHDMQSERLYAPSTKVNLADFRNAELRVLGPAIALRYPYMLKYASDAKRGANPLLVPPALHALSDALLRTGRLDEASVVWGFTPIYESSRNPITLSQQLFRVLSSYPSRSEVKYLQAAASYFSEEEEYIQNRLDYFNRVYSLQIPLGINLGSLSLIGEVNPESIVGPAPFFGCDPLTKHIISNTRYASPHEKYSEILPSIPMEWPLYHIARGCGRGFSAPSKYVNIMASANFPKINPSVVCALADGCGGVLSLMLHLFPRTKGIYNSLIEESHIAIQEQGLYVPSALLGCGSLERVASLQRSVVGASNILEATTQMKISRIYRDLGETGTLLLTMDAESSQDQSWRALLIATRDIASLCSDNYIVICKLIIGESERDGAAKTVYDILRHLNWYWSKPITSCALNNEIFLIFATPNIQLDSIDQSARAVFAKCAKYSRVESAQAFLRLGIRLSHLIPCFNIAAQNLEEITNLKPSSVTPYALMRHAKVLLSATWEEIEKDPHHTSVLKRSGREKILLDLVLPVYLLLIKKGHRRNIN